MPLSRRDCFKLMPATAAAAALSGTPLVLLAGEDAKKTKDLTIKEIRFTSAAIPDPAGNVAARLAGAVAAVDGGAATVA